MYDLGPDSTLVNFNLTPVHRNLTAMGIQAWAMVTAFNLTTFRQALANPKPIIAAIVNECARHTHHLLSWSDARAEASRTAITDSTLTGNPRRMAPRRTPSTMQPL